MKPYKNKKYETWDFFYVYKPGMFCFFYHKFKRKRKWMEQ